MKAMLSTSPGGPETLVLGEIEAPTPGEGEVRIRVHACGVVLGFSYLFRARGGAAARPMRAKGPAKGTADAVLEER